MIFVFVPSLSCYFSSLPFITGSNSSLFYSFISHSSPTSPSLLLKSITTTPTNNPSYLLIATARNFNGFDKHLMSTLTLLDASPKGTVDFEFLIDERYTNINGVMHGGAAGVIFDMCTTTALGPLARPGFWEFVFYFIPLSYLEA